MPGRFELYVEAVIAVEPGRPADDAFGFQLAFPGGEVTLDDVMCVLDIRVPFPVPLFAARDAFSAGREDPALQTDCEVGERLATRAAVGFEEMLKRAEGAPGDQAKLDVLPVQAVKPRPDARERIRAVIQRVVEIEPNQLNWRHGVFSSKKSNDQQSADHAEDEKKEHGSDVDQILPRHRFRLHGGRDMGPLGGEQLLHLNPLGLVGLQKLVEFPVLVDSAAVKTRLQRGDDHRLAAVETVDSYLIHREKP